MKKALPSETFLADLNRFAHTVWGNPHVLLRQLPEAQGVEFIDLGEYSDALKFLFAGILTNDKILIRGEYRTALQALQTKRYRRGAYVTGQPGIGKTYFLVYALVQFLGQKQLVAMQLLNGDPFYVLFGATVTLHPLADTDPLYECPFVWALCDSNADIGIPAGVFRNKPSKVQIIQATPPKQPRWKEWSKQSGAECYVMDIWTKEEVGNLATLMKLDVERMITLAKKWGAVPRTTLEYIDKPDWKVERWYRRRSKQAVAECRAIMNRGVLLDFPDAPSPFYFLRPMKLDTGDIFRELGCMSVPTRTLRTFLAEGLQKQGNLIKLEFYRAMSQSAETRQAAGSIYESWFHCFFSQQRAIKCRWCAKCSDTEGLPTTLSGTTMLAPGAIDTPRTETPPYYWLAPRVNFLGIDSALVLKNEIFTFQVTIGAAQRSPTGGLRELRKILPKGVRDLPWRVVFVGASKSRIKQVAESWAGKLRLNKMCMPVAWSEVDPVQDDITYTAYRDEDDPVPQEFDDESDEEMMEVEGE